MGQCGAKALTDLALQGDTGGQREGVATEHVDVVVAERRQARDILVQDLEAFHAKLVQRGIGVDRVPEHDGVDDQSKSAELIFLPLAVAGRGIGSFTISYAFPCALMLRFERAKNTIMRTQWRRRWSLYV